MSEVSSIQFDFIFLVTGELSTLMSNFRNSCISVNGSLPLLVSNNLLQQIYPLARL